MHPGDDRANGRIGEVLCEGALKPAQLRGVKLFRRDVVKEVERDAALDPVEIGFDQMIPGIVLEALRAQDRRVEPIRKLNDEILARLERGNRFVISDAQEKRDRAERSYLALDEIRPGNGFVFGDGERLGEVLGLVLDVFIESVDGAQVAQVPVELDLIFFGQLGDSRHHHIAAIARVA